MEGDESMTRLQPLSGDWSSRIAASPGKCVFVVYKYFEIPLPGECSEEYGLWCYPKGLNDNGFESGYVTDLELGCRDMWDAVLADAESYVLDLVVVPRENPILCGELVHGEVGRAAEFKIFGSDAPVSAGGWKGRRI